MRFGIDKDRVGPLLKSTKISELETLFSLDSVVQPVEVPGDIKASGNIEIFEKGGKQLLSLTPSTDSIARIENIRIHDPRYTTPQGITLLSTFKDIKEKYTIKKVITSLNNIVILLKDNDLYFTISKDELPAELRFSTAKIDMVQIPDGAKIKYMMIGWD
jgi:hypothetical protein